MAAASLITLRETLEASLIVCIVLAYLRRTQHARLERYVWWGVVAGLGTSVGLAVVFQTAFGGLTGRAEEIYEGTTMVVATGLLTWMILWMLKQRRTIRGDIEGKVATHLENDHPMGIFLLTLVSTAREGIETVIFLKATIVHTGFGYHFLGSALGIATAVLLAFLLYKGIELVPLRKFFTVTSVLLILFAAGLLAHGVHEFQEAGVVPILTGPLWDISHLLRDTGGIGAFLKTMFGYNADPSALEVGSYVLYLLGISVAWRRITAERA